MKKAINKFRVQSTCNKVKKETNMTNRSFLKCKLLSNLDELKPSYIMNNMKSHSFLWWKGTKFGALDKTFNRQNILTCVFVNGWKHLTNKLRITLLSSVFRELWEFLVT